MKKALYLILFCTTGVFAQIQYGTPQEDQLPEALTQYPRVLQVDHFPREVHPVKIDADYYWKHNTVVMSPTEEVEVVEFGAYVYYNEQWNLRKKYPLKDFDKLFGAKKHKMLAAQPYTWNDNWRVGPNLFDGWALWYFIGKTESGQLVCGYQKLYTTDTPIKK